MRKLQTSDVFNALRLVKKAGIKEQLIPYMQELAKKEKNVENLGIASILTFIEILTEAKAEQCIYEVLAGPLEMEPERIAQMNLQKFTECIERLGKENDLRSFFIALAGMITKK